MFNVRMEYWYYGMPVETEEDYIIMSKTVSSMSEANALASEYASEAERKLRDTGVEWGYEYPGMSFDGLGRKYYISGGGENYEIYICKPE